jgi:hypothetical protein
VQATAGNVWPYMAETTDSAVSLDARPVDEVTSWLEAGYALRQKLIAERERLLARVSEIDDALASLPGDDGGDSVPEKVRRVLRASAGALSAPQVIEALRATDPVLEPRLVHSALHRLVKKQEVIAEGDAGTRVYLWKRSAEEA